MPIELEVAKPAFKLRVSASNNLVAHGILARLAITLDDSLLLKTAKVPYRILYPEN